MKRSAIGILLIAASVAAMLWWELAGRDSVMYTQVLTVNRDISQGTVISQDMLELKKTTTPTPDSLRASDVRLVAGKEAVSFLPAGAELFAEYFEDESLIVHASEGEFIFSIPPAWLVSCPQTLRRGDSVTFLAAQAADSEEGPALPAPGSEILTAAVLFVKSSSNDEVTSDTDRLGSAESVSLIEIITDSDGAKTLTQLAANGCRFVLLYR